MILLSQTLLLLVLLSVTLLSPTSLAFVLPSTPPRQATPLPARRRGKFNRWKSDDDDEEERGSGFGNVNKRRPSKLE